MSSLVLELKQGETMVLNGALIRFQTKTRLELHGYARFLFGKQLLRVEDVTTPARQVYYGLQQAYLGPDEAREAALAQVHEMMADYIKEGQTQGDWAAWRALCVEPTMLAALKHGRRIIQAETKGGGAHDVHK